MMMALTNKKIEKYFANELALFMQQKQKNRSSNSSFKFNLKDLKMTKKGRNV